MDRAIPDEYAKFESSLIIVFYVMCLIPNAAAKILSFMKGDFV